MKYYALNYDNESRSPYQMQLCQPQANLSSLFVNSLNNLLFLSSMVSVLFCKVTTENRLNLEKEIFEVRMTQFRFHVDILKCLKYNTY